MPADRGPSAPPVPIYPRKPSGYEPAPGVVVHKPYAPVPGHPHRYGEGVQETIPYHPRPHTRERPHAIPSGGYPNMPRGKYPDVGQRA